MAYCLNVLWRNKSMSMREYPTSGYVVPVEQLRKVISGFFRLTLDKEQELQTKLDELLEEGDHEQIAEFLNENLPENFPACSAYRPSDEDTVDEPMEQGVWYAVFDEDDLYTRRLSEAGEALKKAGVEPALSHWSVWG
jgi:hypothetical protein